ncbi:MAG: hypothetical protein N3B01_02705 [Verrucomicrobiae bacterium]|nr:hypothetical protein [Verrucomicrobiae bacterium]
MRGVCAVLPWALVALSGLHSGAATPAPSQAVTNFPGPMLQRFLDGPMRGVEEIVFAVRVPGRDHWYVTFGNYSDHSDYARQLGFKFEDGVYWGYGEGGRLCALNLRSGKIRVLLDDPKGGVRDPQVHYSGKKILFSYRKGGTHTYHLYEINTDGTGLRQLTDGPDDDIEPTYCPDDSIVFCSARCRRFVNCWYTRVATLYRCDPDGRNIRMLSSNNDHDNTPWMLPDGRVLYMRWEYVDRSQVHFHHLWTMNPDGTSQMVFYGNMHGGVAMLDAKPIPGSHKIVSIFSPGHGRPEHLGPVVILDPKLGPDDLTAARQIGKGRDWKDPYAFGEDCFLVAHPKGLYVMDGNGEAELIYQLPPEDKHLQVHEPRPIIPRPREHIIPNRVNLAAPTGTLFLQDIYHGRNMRGVERGAVKKLLVLKQLPKPVNFSGGMEPLTIGGSFTLAEIVGEVPVEPDGSAYMEVPALQSLFFVALDQNDISVKRMHSFLTVQPGETMSCLGCHEHRQTTLPTNASAALALRRPPTPVTPIKDVPSVLDYPRDIQPILDRHCVSCHNPDQRDGGVDLCGDKTAMYTISYWTMRTRNLVSDGRNEPRGNRDPYSYGSAASRLMKLIDGSHYNARLNDLERKTIRLWIETSATYPGTYAALGCGFYPVHLPIPEIKQRCGQCHTTTVQNPNGKKITTLAFGDDWGHRLEPYSNLSRPEKSLILRAPLAKEAGGLALCEQISFKDTNDPLYKQILAAIQDAHRRLMTGKRFDMPGFRPNEHYIREMQRFGFLPKNLSPDAPIDIYAIDRAYWDSFNYLPPSQPAAAQVHRTLTFVRLAAPRAARNSQQKFFKIVVDMYYRPG